MNYLSLTFVVFVTIVALFYYLSPVKCRGGVLLIASIAFYACFNWKYLFFLLFTALSTFLVALFLEKMRNKKLWIGLCVGANVAVWFAIKELSWALDTLCRALGKFGVTIQSPTISFLVPVGISYFTLQAIAYLIDVSKGKIQAEKKFWCYLLFLSWFPAIVQGPISRYNDLQPQLLNTKKISYETSQQSLILILFGLVKKMVIADRLGIFANDCFANHGNLGGVILYFGALAYSFQLYADFSGCVDICRGVSRLFNIELTHNFNRPYLARSINEFWARWHLSLSRWLKDYIYIPLGGNRKGTARKYLNIIVTFLVSGLWHGAGFHFFLWGLMHAIYQIIGAATLSVREKIKVFIGIKKGSASERIYQIIITFHLVALAWIVFRSSGLTSAVIYIKNMFSVFDPWVLFDGSLFKHGLSQNHITLLIAHLVAMFALERRYSKQEDSVVSLQRSHLILRWGICILLIFDILLFGVYGSGYEMASFMYGGF